MQKNRTKRQVFRALRRGLALFMAAAALWLVWLTGDPAAALSQLTGLASDAQLTAAVRPQVEAAVEAEVRT